MASYEIAGGYSVHDQYILAVRPPIRESWLCDKISALSDALPEDQYVVSVRPDCIEFAFDQKTLSCQDNDVIEAAAGVLRDAGHIALVHEQDVVLGGLGSVFEQMSTRAV